VRLVSSWDRRIGAIEPVTSDASSFLVSLLNMVPMLQPPAEQPTATSDRAATTRPIRDRPRRSVTHIGNAREQAWHEGAPGYATGYSRHERSRHHQNLRSVNFR
jgi:hypothetical protein